MKTALSIARLVVDIASLMVEAFHPRNKRPDVRDIIPQELQD